MAIKASELVLAGDGSLYHIRLTGDTLADDVLLVGDPGRVSMFKEIFDTVEFETSNREIHALTGSYHGHRFTALSTGMGCDNIDIVATELDAAANIDLANRIPREGHRSLNLVRIGTSGTPQPDIPCGSLVASKYAIGLDGLLNYYVHDDSGFDKQMEEAFVRHTQLPGRLATPYCVPCGRQLLERVADGMRQGITVTAPGFYGPQGRCIRLEPAIDHFYEKLSTFQWDGTQVTNIEMETSAIFGFAKTLGHQALTVCLIIANRPCGTFINDYHKPMRDAIGTIIERLAL